VNILKLLEIYKDATAIRQAALDELTKKLSWESLADNGLLVPAIMSYRNTYKDISVSDAKKAVEAYIKYEEDVKWGSRTKKS